LFGPRLPKKKPMSKLESTRWRIYGLTQADYDLMVAAQNGLCAICERRPSGRLCVDHDHATRWLRFLLCRKCNIGFGHFDEDPRLLRRAADYAEFWQRLQAADIAVRLVPEAKPRRQQKKAEGVTVDAEPCSADNPRPVEPGTRRMGGAGAIPINDERAPREVMGIANKSDNVRSVCSTHPTPEHGTAAKRVSPRPRRRIATAVPRSNMCNHESG